MNLTFYVSCIPGSFLGAGDSTGDESPSFHRFCISYNREIVCRNTLPILERNRQRKGEPGGGDDSWTPLAAECGQGRTGRGQPSRRNLHEVRLQR